MSIHGPADSARPWWVWTVGVLLVVVAAVTGYVLFSSSPKVAGAGTVVSPPPSTSPSSVAAPTPSTVRLTAVTAGQHVLFIGNSWTAGSGAASPATQNWAAVAAKALGWRAEIHDVPTGGFVAHSTSNHRTYLTLITDLPKSTPAPTLVVVQGSDDDNRAADLARLPAAEAALFAAVHKRWPHAQLLEVGPMSLAAIASTSLQSLSATLATGAATGKVAYIDAYGWITPANHVKYLNVKRRLPSTAGNAYIAQRFEAAYKALAAK